MFGYDGDFAVINTEGCIVFCCESFATAVGFRRIDMTGMNINSWIQCESETSCFSSSESSLRKCVIESPVSGCVFCRMEPLAHEKLDGWYVIILEKSDFIIEDGLNELHCAAFHINPGLSAITSVDTGVHLDVNNAWLRATGYKRDEVIGKSAQELNIWQEPSIREDIVRQLQDTRVVNNFEARLRKKSGGTIDVIVSAELVFHRGRPLCFFASLDVTEINKAHRLKNVLLRKLRDLKQDTLLDPLTGIANRRHLDIALLRSWNMCRREHFPISLLLIDVDYFKKYNDHYGHQAGDEVLRRLADAMDATGSRPYDILCRYGGEEFCYLLPGSDLEGARHVAREILHSVRSLGISHATSLVEDRVTVSIGVGSVIPREHLEIEHLIGMADKNLYKAKNKGRARIEG